MHVLIIYNPDPKLSQFAPILKDFSK